MLRKIVAIFTRDFKISMRDSIAILIIFIPVVIAIAIAIFTPGLNDTTITVAMLKNDDAKHIEYFQQAAKVELFDNSKQLEERVNKRDHVAAISPISDGYEIILQGNEPSMVKDYTALLNALYELGATKEQTTAQIMSFGRTVPPLKTMMVNMLISMTIMLVGMIIAIGIVEEKASNTINAINVSPLSQMGFAVGKSIFGGIMALIGIVASLLITGYYDINWFMLILVGITSMVLSLVVGFLQGLYSDDLMEAAASVKLLMLPIAGSIVGYELLSDKWQWTMYWSPFYWAYKANLQILSKTADWATVLLSTGMVLLLSMIVYFAALPKIRKGLS